MTAPQSKLLILTCAHEECGQQFEWVKKRGRVPSYCSPKCKLRAYQLRNPGCFQRSRSCLICGETFSARSSSQKTCSPDCSRSLRLVTLKEISRRTYVPRAPRPDAVCEACGETTPQAKTGPPRRWCSRCRATQEDERTRRRHRPAVRPCCRCGTGVPEQAGKPGITVCEDCRGQRSNEARIANERRRRLKRYGLTEEGYAALLAAQNGRCAGCRTTKPGIKGWCIDHCHETGRTRSILCSPCNSALGLCKENPATLRRLARLATDFNQLQLII